MDKKIVKDIEELIQLDTDATYAYEEAIDSVDEGIVRDNLSSFKQDHERHIAELSEFLRNNGEEPPKVSKDFKGFVIEGFTKARSSTGTEGALKAMQSNEKITNKKYEDALNKDLPPELRQIVQRNREDERRHLEYIEQALRERPWEAAA